MPRASPKPVATVAGSREETAALIGRLGELRRERIHHEVEYGTRAVILKREFDPLFAKLDAEIKEIETKVIGWCRANREAGQKSLRFPTGLVRFRLGRFRVVIADVEKAIAQIKALGLTRFLRTKEEINHQALLAERAVAETIPGVSVSRKPEEIVVEPL